MIQHIFIVSVLFLVCSGILQAKIRFLTFYCNRANLIELQYKLLKKYLKNDHEIIVINDAPDPTNESEICSMCDKYHIQCVRYEQDLHFKDPLNIKIQNYLSIPGIRSFVGFSGKKLEDVAQQPSIRHSHLIQFALDRYGYSPGRSD
jgi:hypothetical protein